MIVACQWNAFSARSWEIGVTEANFVSIRDMFRPVRVPDVVLRCVGFVGKLPA